MGGERRVDWERGGDGGVSSGEKGVLWVERKHITRVMGLDDECDPFLQLN
jgi:hypothetical protein